jgi:hypothetical protein
MFLLTISFWGEGHWFGASKVWQRIVFIRNQTLVLSNNLFAWFWLWLNYMVWCMW